MNGFLLARPDGVLRASGVRAVFDAVNDARAALRTGAAAIVVGALPFDPARPAALVAPAEQVHTAGPWRPAALPPLPRVQVVSEFPSAGEHLARVTKLVEQLDDPDTELRKVVAARSVLAEADGVLEPGTVAAQLAARHPGASVFAVDLTAAGRTGATLIGASPELLVARQGRTVTLHPLAGTAPAPGPPAPGRAPAAGVGVNPHKRPVATQGITWVPPRSTPQCD
ncbi:chorismate-binding protein, partial [Nocardia farcinica]|uniref:chorismate-binding protein n=1 Tax=Nocardia farcinica TaxID=37329 RepID=UPI002456C2C0